MTQQYHQLPKQIVTPYKPSDDHDQTPSLTRASSDVSDRAPLLKKVGGLTNKSSKILVKYTENLTKDIESFIRLLA
ncbi:hypothetical protein E2C01_053776 [Portunus trituberculatus]|uniref:Uncharacterized protein n=1 Tax=Portunus trituberculatus TaxID=210409 RepID=A0A5B7GRQ7_PORTR|nr:hypothetical protein [Portunus trituberculatus]